MQKQRISIGRTVHFRVCGKGDGFDEIIRPAVATNVFGNGDHANLTVFLDPGNDDTPRVSQALRNMGASITLDANNHPVMAVVYSRSEGEGEGNWSWPARV